MSHTTISGRPEGTQRATGADFNPINRAQIFRIVDNLMATMASVTTDAERREVARALKLAIALNESRVRHDERRRCARLAVDVSRAKVDRYRNDRAPLPAVAAVEATGADIEHAIVHPALATLPGKQAQS